jgi:hypothetical protein
MFVLGPASRQGFASDTRANASPPARQAYGAVAWQLREPFRQSIHETYAPPFKLLLDAMTESFDPALRPT